MPPPSKRSSVGAEIKCCARHTGYSGCIRGSRQPGDGVAVHIRLGDVGTPMVVRIKEEISVTVPSPDQLVVSCAAGGRSMHACELLVAEGYSNLVNMHGGFSGARDMSGVVLQDGWEALGYPTTDEPQADRTYDALRGA